jgi:hypothetical protein
MPRARLFHLPRAGPLSDRICPPAPASHRGAKLPRWKGRTMAPRVAGRKVDAVGESPKNCLAPSSDAGDIGPTQSFLGGPKLLTATRHGAGRRRPCGLGRDARPGRPG